MRPSVHSSLGVVLALGLLSGCSGSDTVPVVSPTGPVAAVEDQRDSPEPEALTSEEAALVSQAESEPDPASLPDL
ncbi:MAG: hypothetical protein NNA21_06730 [Nitrospira sp.]|nr:hypothetical protein [Nitrospira sp.]MCP9460704.1 hypothetical protein [Nitrospira sp.]MCP9474558.1 hypothetical protein [Nitrospira sp.]